MIRFHIFGIPVHIHPFFWITLIIIGGYDANTPAAILRIGLFVLAAFFSVLVHELGHALAARKFGAYSEITLQAFGGYATYSGVNLSRSQSFAVTAAGPAIQLLLGAAVYLMIPHLLPNLNDQSFYFLKMLVFISFFWAILNLLPVLPLDGGQMLNAVLGPRRIKITLWVTVIVAVSVGLLMYQHTGSILFPLFLAVFAWRAFQEIRQ